MAKATTTLRQVLNYRPHHASWFAATQSLFNQVAAFYFEVIIAHKGVLDLSNKEALTALEILTHATQKNPTPVMPLIKQQIITNAYIKVCAVDLNINEHLAVCTIRTVAGTILATKFIGGGREIDGFRKKQLGRIARNRRKTGIIAEGERDNGDLWRKITHADEDLSHLVSVRIVQFAKEHEATILVFEHLGNLKPAKGKYSRRSNSKRAFWMKGRIFKYSKYKAYKEGMLTSRVNPHNTSRECARCHSLLARYAASQPAEGYAPGAPLVLCHKCGMQGNADRNASLVIGQRLIGRYQKLAQEKPPTPLATERGTKVPGGVVSQDAKSKEGPSIQFAWHGDDNEHGTAQGVRLGMAQHTSDIPRQLRLFNES